MEKKDERNETKRATGTSRTIDDDFDDGPTDEEVDAWAEHERKRRERWLAGPTEREKSAWARQHRTRTRRRVDSYYDSSGEPDIDPTVRRFWRENELATKGVLDYFYNGPLYVWSRLVRAGRNLEEEGFFPRVTPRVSFYDD
jgi:hypothetical protein